MRYSRFEFQKKSPIFRPPKYTGITLSLLSIFVLVSMLAVWEKMAAIPDLPVLHILAWNEAKIPLESARLTYQKEASCLLNISYFPVSELSSNVNDRHPKTNKPWDILLIPELDQTGLALAQKHFDMHGPVASIQEKMDRLGTKAKDGKSISLNYWINQSSRIQTEALSFYRFLKAPTKGQVEFAQNDWIGISDDPWDKSPQLTIYAIKPCNEALNTLVEDFAKTRGIDFRISFLDEQGLHASLQILTKANNENYLPDIIFLPVNTNKFSFLEPFYSQVDTASKISNENYSILLRKKSSLLKTIHKLLVTLSDY
jgi:hypothetical protein